MIAGTATIEALKRPGAAEPAKAGDAVVAPKQTGEQGFYKVWVSDAPIAAEYRGKMVKRASCAFKNGVELVW